MGEYADMILDGEMCEGCGIFLDGASGFPQRCRGCGGDADELDLDEFDEVEQ